MYTAHASQRAASKAQSKHGGFPTNPAKLALEVSIPKQPSAASLTIASANQQEIKSAISSTPSKASTRAATSTLKQKETPKIVDNSSSWEGTSAREVVTARRGDVIRGSGLPELNDKK